MPIPALHEHKHPRLHRAFYDFHTISFTVISDILAFLTLVSIFAIILDTLPEFTAYHKALRIVEYLCVGIFTAEYIVRLYAATSPKRYALSFFGIVDLLAILPTYFGFANLTALKSARMIRMLTFFRLIRVSKIGRTEIEVHRRDLEENAAVYRFNIIMYFFTLFAAVVLLGALMNAFEHDQVAFADLHASMLWVFGTLVGTNLSVGVPVTTPGVILAILTRFTGLILLGFLIHIVGDVINEILRNERRRKKRPKATA